MTNPAAELALRMVEDVQDDPARRLDLAAAFYDDRPGRVAIQGYRRAELSFMHWQVRRGALAPTSGPRPGSRWWRAINARLLSDSWEAHHLTTGVPGTASRPAVARWVEFLDRPSPRSWYRAHNTSVAAAYIEYRGLTEAELPVERFFMDVTLGRVLFIHSVLLQPRSALGPFFWPAGRILADPRSRSVDVYLSLRNILPDAYPIAGQSITEILDAENFAGRLVDYGILLPRAPSLYEFAAADLGEPGLRDFINDGSLTYAWAFADRAVWEPRRYRRLTALVARIARSY
ncbi:MAG: hypothetical protein ABWY45_19395 [Mycobacterium sp.]